MAGRPASELPQWPNTPEFFERRKKITSFARLFKEVAAEGKTRRQMKETLRGLLQGAPTPLWLETVKFMTDHLDGKPVQRVEMDTPQNILFQIMPATPAALPPSEEDAS